MPRWTLEAREKQSQLIKRVKPWIKSTGPRSEEGKAKVSQNACKPLQRIHSKTLSTYKGILGEITTYTESIDDEIIDYWQESRLNDFLEDDPSWLSDDDEFY